MRPSGSRYFTYAPDRNDRCNAGIGGFLSFVANANSRDMFRSLPGRIDCQTLSAPPTARIEDALPAPQKLGDGHLVARCQLAATGGWGPGGRGFCVRGRDDAIIGPLPPPTPTNAHAAPPEVSDFGAPSFRSELLRVERDFAPPRPPRKFYPRPVCRARRPTIRGFWGDINMRKLTERARYEYIHGDVKAIRLLAGIRIH